MIEGFLLTLEKASPSKALGEKPTSDPGLGRPSRVCHARPRGNNARHADVMSSSDGHRMAG
jgi:hypothetical protein